MPITHPSGNYTGLMAYSRRFENFGLGLPFRIVEKYDYEIYDIELTGRRDLRQYFKSQFSQYLGVFTGDINITSFSVPNGNSFGEDAIRSQKHTVSIETYKSDQYQNGYGNAKLTGISGVIASHYHLLKDLSENFNFDSSEAADKSYRHDLSFSLKTGDGYLDFSSLKNAAEDIATDIYDSDGAAGLSKIGFQDYAQYTTGNATQIYYTETFDALRNSFSFSKTRGILSSSSSGYTYNLSHSIAYDQEGFFKIDERIKVAGNKTYSQAVSGFNSVLAGSESRCESIVTGYFPLTNLQTNSSNSNISNLVRLASNKTCVVPTLSIEGSVSYTNNPNFQTGLSRNSNVSIQKLSNGAIEMEHSIDYSLNAHIVGRTDNIPVSGSSTIMGVLSTDAANSAQYCMAIYSGLTNITGLSPAGLNRTKSSYSAPQRGKSCRASFSYTDNPVYNIDYVNPFNSTAITGLTQLEISVDQSRPKDIIREYKVINRPSKQTILSYGYQQELSTASVSYKGVLTRRDNNFDELYLPTGEVAALVAHSKPTFLNRVLLGADMFNFFMSSAKYDFNSDGDLGVTVEYSYTLKK